MLHDLVPVEDFHPQRLPHILSFSRAGGSSVYDVVTMLIDDDLYRLR